jgi:predicted adenine nucleotide alpha hydrolase (AANH) superfamily ATPase
MKLLLHTCCGPCFLGVWEDLETKDIEVTNYFFNPNIYPKEEFQRRLEGLEIAADGRSNDVIVPDHEVWKYKAAVRGFENEFPARCTYCYELRLEATAKYAKEHGYDAFSTTLLVSPYQQHKVLKQVCEKIGEQYGINFYYTDWRPFFRSGQEKARFIPIYRQKYCGCQFSLQPEK